MQLVVITNHEDNTVWRMNKNGGIKSIPLDRSYSKYKIIHVGKSI